VATESDHFYARTVEERAELTRQSIQERRTLLERWAALGRENTGGWNRRARVAAKWLAEQPAVADLGCGTQLLEPCLAPGTRYVPVDVVRRDERTVVVDFNREALPALPARAAAALGLFEYLFDPGRLVRSMQPAFDLVAVSYNPADLPDAHPRREEHAWVNSMSRAEFEGLFTGQGFVREKRYNVDLRQVMWLFRAMR
jgi:hypothetical protein